MKSARPWELHALEINAGSSAVRNNKHGQGMQREIDKNRQESTRMGPDEGSGIHQRC